MQRIINRRITLWMLIVGAAPAVASTGDGSMDDQVEFAVAALAERLGVDRVRIEVVEAEPVTWPDASLGCPHPDMKYRQVPVDGYRILLRVDGREYAFHGGGQRAPFLCQHPAVQPMEPILPRPEA
jgi:hypothetical protein